MWKDDQKSEVLADWQYEPDLWRDFIEYESGIYSGSVRAAKHFFFISPIIMLLLFILVLKISSLVSDEWNVTMLILKISFGCCIFFSILAGGNLWHKRHNNWKQLNRRSGEVLITLNGLNINGLDFVWTSEPHGLHFWTSKPYGLFLRNIERKSVTLNSGKNFEILVFSMVNNIPIDGGTLQYIECRVPIPFGKELEADYLIKQIKKNVTNQV